MPSAFVLLRIHMSMSTSTVYPNRHGPAVGARLINWSAHQFGFGTSDMRTRAVGLKYVAAENGSSSRQFLAKQIVKLEEFFFFWRERMGHLLTVALRFKICPET